MDAVKHETFLLWSELRFGHEAELTIEPLLAVQDAWREGDGFEASLLGAMRAALAQGGLPLWNSIWQAGLAAVAESEIRHRQEVAKTRDAIEGMKSQVMKDRMNEDLTAKVIRQRTGEIWRTWDIED